MIKYGKAYKFSQNAVADNPFADVENTELKDADLEFYFGNSPSPSIYGNTVRRLGWAIPIIGVKSYVVKSKYDSQWLEYVSPNKTFLRRRLGSHNIVKIVEVDYD